MSTESSPPWESQISFCLLSCVWFFFKSGCSAADNTMKILGWSFLDDGNVTRSKTSDCFYRILIIFVSDHSLIFKTETVLKMLNFNFVSTWLITWNEFIIHCFHHFPRRLLIPRLHFVNRRLHKTSSSSISSSSRAEPLLTDIKIVPVEITLKTWASRQWCQPDSAVTLLSGTRVVPCAPDNMKGRNGSEIILEAVQKTCDHYRKHPNLQREKCVGEVLSLETGQ